MGSRLDLHTLLISILGSTNVYFQPPSSTLMQYPCIVYQRSKINTRHANNGPYHHEKKYQVTVIDRNPDSEIVDAVMNLPKCLFDRHFTSENLNHDVFNIYF